MGKSTLSTSDVTLWSAWVMQLPVVNTPNSFSFGASIFYCVQSVQHNYSRIIVTEITELEHLEQFSRFQPPTSARLVDTIHRSIGLGDFRRNEVGALIADTSVLICHGNPAISIGDS